MHLGTQAKNYLVQGGKMSFWYDCEKAFIMAHNLPCTGQGFNNNSDWSFSKAIVP